MRGDDGKKNGENGRRCKFMSAYQEIKSARRRKRKRKRENRENTRKNRIKQTHGKPVPSRNTHSVRRENVEVLHRRWRTGGGGQAVDKRAIEQKHVEIITESGI